MIACMRIRMSGPSALLPIIMKLLDARTCTVLLCMTLKHVGEACELHYGGTVCMYIASHTFCRVLPNLMLEPMQIMQSNESLRQ